MKVDHSYDGFFDSILTALIACTLLITLGKSFTNHYFAYIMLLLSSILIVLATIDWWRNKTYRKPEQEDQTQQKALKMLRENRSKYLKIPLGRRSHTYHGYPNKKKKATSVTRNATFTSGSTAVRKKATITNPSDRKDEKRHSLESIFGLLRKEFDSYGTDIEDESLLGAGNHHLQKKTSNDNKTSRDHKKRHSLDGITGLLKKELDSCQKKLEIEALVRSSHTLRKTAVICAPSKEEMIRSFEGISDTLKKELESYTVEVTKNELTSHTSNYLVKKFTPV